MTAPTVDNTQGEIRTHVVLPARLVHQMDAMVGPRKRSQFVVDAVQKELVRRERLAVAEEVAGTLTDLAIPEWGTPEGAAAWVHRTRHEADRPGQ